MTDRPILFSAPMVRALLDGRKTQTRRVAKFVQPDGDGWHIRNSGGGVLGADDDDVRAHAADYAPYAPGDRLWVKETSWICPAGWTNSPVNPMGPDRREVAYVADDLRGGTADAAKDYKLKKTPSIFMPRWASRITLTVTVVRVERLQDISEADAIAEGIAQYGRFYGLPDTDWDDAELSPVRAYHRLWDSINGEGAWDANPWVAAISFDVQLGNIDA